MSAGPEQFVLEQLRPIVERLLPSDIIENESWEDTWAGVLYLASKRASLRGEDLNALDILRMLYLCGACPFPHYHYSPDYGQDLARARAYMFEGAAAGQRDRIDTSVPAGSILLEFDAMDILHARHDLDGFLRLPPDIVHPPASLG
jgi:hypothetical protein